jgi:hypothetical protein
MQSFGKTRLILAFTLLAVAPLIARLGTKQIGYVAEHARELVGKSLWVDGCVNSQADSGKFFQLGDGTGAISILSSSAAPPAGTCMELNGVMRQNDTGYVLEERARKIH